MHLKTKIAYIIIFASVLFYGYNVFAYSLNIPILDDFDAVLGSLIRFDDAGSVLERLQVFFMQHNEHRIVVPKLFVFANYYIGGAVDFRTLIFFGNLGLLGLIIVLAKFSSGKEGWAPYYASALLIILQPQQWENMVWAMSALPNFFVLFWVSLSLYLLAYRRSAAALALSILSAVLSVFTFANGLAVFPVGLILLIAQRRRSDSVIWAASGVLLAAFYFYGFVKPQHHPAIIGTIAANPFNFIRYFFTYAGSSFFVAPAVAGGVLSVFFVYLAVSGYYKRNPGLFSMLLFLFTTAFLTAIARSGFGVEQALSSRYKTATALILALSLVALMEELGDRLKRFVVPALLAASIAFNAASYLEYHGAIRNLNAEMRAGLALWKAGAGMGLVYNDYRAADRLLRESMKKGIYLPPDYPLPVEAEGGRK